jgi:hypothetical protein
MVTIVSVQHANFYRCTQYYTTRISIGTLSTTAPEFLSVHLVLKYPNFYRYTQYYSTRICIGTLSTTAPEFVSVHSVLQHPNLYRYTQYYSTRICIGTFSTIAPEYQYHDIYSMRLKTRFISRRLSLYTLKCRECVTNRSI